MRKWLILILLLVLAGLGLVYWLGEGAKKAVPEEGEVRIEIEDAL